VKVQKRKQDFYHAEKKKYGKVKKRRRNLLVDENTSPYHDPSSRLVILQLTATQTVKAKCRHASAVDATATRLDLELPQLC